ncbi:hypothetical protein XENTR_v10018870 [Xenopus tropicalis]|nr:hypothetical protein XENTR_v10018870 [Xenopus tropicalis]
MAVPCAIFLGRFIADTVGVSILSMVYDCCSERDLNGSCSISHRCSPGCYRLWSEDGSSTCVKCKNETSLGSEVIPNVTECRNFGSSTLDISLNSSSTPYVPHNLASIFQPSEMASMIPNPKSSVRKPRYVRRERSRTTAAPDSSAETRVSNV